jgi:hypothetical protein
MKPFRPVGHQAVTARMATLRLGIDFPLREIEPRGPSLMRVHPELRTSEVLTVPWPYGPSSHPAQCNRRCFDIGDVQGHCSRYRLLHKVGYFKK